MRSVSTDRTSRGPLRTLLSGTGVRQEWGDLPATVREVIESHFSGPIRRIEVQRGGFSPAFAGILTSSSGEEVFVKAAGPDLNPEVPAIYRREWGIASQLPEEVPTPKPRWSEDDGRWVSLAFEAVRGGNPRLPWKRTDLNRVVRTLEKMTRVLTPAPIQARSFQERHSKVFRGFRNLLDGRDLSDAHRRLLDPWIRSHLQSLAEIEAEWEEAALGSTLLHCDVRADNIVLRENQVFFVDWAGACVGPAWVELLAFLPSVSMQGGPTPWEIFDRCKLGREAPTNGARAMLTALTGYFVEQSLRPPPPGLPTLREFQRAQGQEAVRWLRRLMPDFR
jgi:aminoglycoside phosphotransferase